MLTAKDIRGVCVMMPTPTIEGGGDWRVENSVDLEEAARFTETFIRDGVGSFAVCGTTGECASLLWEEKAAFVDTIVQVNSGRIPIFAGATSLGTKETIRQMRALKEIGADGAFVGLPLWQTPTAENSVQWFADLSEAVPDMPIMVYSNSMFFKSVFPTEFWEAVAKAAPTVITNKIASPTIQENLEAIVEVTNGRISFLPLQANAANARERVGDKIQGLWSTAAAMGPEPVVALWAAIERGDKERLAAIQEDMKAVPPAMPPEKRGEDFPKYNSQLN
ncbi:MAG: dihydrodipicolinate synthase family protein [Dehalococcoidia bacterium]